ncbi:MAG: SCO family protein [Gammaproteobacteria bacterium]|nr:SCO family protein [Gammaproteobacteria bacterium]
MYNLGLLRIPVAAASVFAVLLSTSPHGVSAEDHSHHQQMIDKNSGYSVTKANYPLPKVKLINTEGESVSLDSIVSDGPLLLNFIFTTCTAICPIMTATFMEVQDAASKQSITLKQVSISIDPEQDTPAVLQGYAKKFHARDDWRFYTGDKTDIIKIQKAFKTYRGNKMNHTPLTLIRMSSTAQWVRIEGFASATDVIDEYRKLMTE